MKYKVLFKEQAQNQLQQLSRSYRADISEKIVLLGNDPNDPALPVKKVEGKSYYGLKVGTLQVIFNKRDEEKIIAIEKIERSLDKNAVDFDEIRPDNSIKFDENITLKKALATQAAGHSNSIAPAEKPDLEIIAKPANDGYGQGYQATGTKQHPALDTNQFRGANTDGHKPSSPSEMDADQLEAALGELKLNPGQELTKRLEPGPAPAPTPSTPTPRPV